MFAPPGRAAGLAGLLVILVACWPTLARAADTADDSQGLDVRRLSSDQRRRLVAGEAIIYAVPETSDVELAAGVAMYLPVPLARAAEASGNRVRVVDWPDKELRAGCFASNNCR